MLVLYLFLFILILHIDTKSTVLGSMLVWFILSHSSNLSSTFNSFPEISEPELWHAFYDRVCGAYIYL